jgi:hypothetical protein
MAEIKRPNYFTSQFLVEKDFNDEQAYHVGMRRRLNRVLHASGVADGLAVTRVSATQVQVSSGTAIDNQGREITLEDARTYTLTTVGNNLDVYLTIAYGEFLDPADKDTQAGLDKFRRTTERALLQDGSADPPTNGSVILLARIHLSASGTIESDGSIDSTVRTLASARLAPGSVGTPQLEDGSVTFSKFAGSARPTAQMVDNQDGTNRIVAQINAGTGVISRARVQTDMVTGVVVFTNVMPNGSLQVSDEIDAGLGVGPLAIQLSLDDLNQASMTSVGTVNFSLRSELDRSTGRFRVFLARGSGTGTTGAIRVRWHAFKPIVIAPETNSQVGVSISPQAPTIGGNSPQLLTATVTNAAQGVTWSGPGSGNQVTATSITDTSKSATVSIVVTGEIAVNLSQTTASLVRGQSVTLSGTVINTPNVGITWSIQNNAGGTLSSTSGASTTYTAPAAPGTYTVIAKSVADTTKTRNCVVTVLPVSISVSADDTSIIRNTSTTVRASISPGIADNRATWAVTSGGGSVTAGPSATATYSAPNSATTATITGTSVSDSSKSQSVQITVTVPGGGPGPGPGPGPGKFAPSLIPVEENLVPEGVLVRDAKAGAPAPTDASTPADASKPADASTLSGASTASSASTATGSAAKKPRTFVRPQKRAATDTPEPSDE